jgi:hypothetical protein
VCPDGHVPTSSEVRACNLQVLYPIPVSFIMVVHSMNYCLREGRVVVQHNYRGSISCSPQSSKMILALNTCALRMSSQFLLADLQRSKECR